MRKLRDALGSYAAELVLQIVGERLRSLIAYEGTIASLSGTQFALLVNETGPRRIRWQLRRSPALPSQSTARVRRLRSPQLWLRAYPEDGDDVPTLMRRAHVALSAASAAGGNVVRRFSKAFEGQAARRFELETMLREALDRQQLHLVYQPQITLATGRIAQVETLLRWRTRSAA